MSGVCGGSVLSGKLISNSSMLLNSNITASNADDYFIDSMMGINESLNGSAVLIQGPIMLTQAEHFIVIILYTIISILAIGGNSMVIWLIFNVNKLRTATNLLIANLALADILMACLCIPFSYWPVLILQYWPFGPIMCKIINPAQAVVVFLSSYTLVAISFDRFLAIMFPLKPNLRLTHTSAYVVILLVWIMAIILATPLLIVMELCPDEMQLMWCDERWDQFVEGSKEWYNFALFLLQYLVPVLVLTITYTGIGLKIWFTRVPGENDTHSNANKQRRDSVRHMIPMMVLITALYALCWLPQNLLWNLPIADALIAHRQILRIWWAVHMTAMSHSIVNPIVYYFRNDYFHNGFRYIFRCIPGIKYNPINSNINLNNTLKKGVYTTKRPRQKSGAESNRIIHNFDEETVLVENSKCL